MGANIVQRIMIPMLNLQDKAPPRNKWRTDAIIAS